MCQMNKKGAEEKLGRAVDHILIEKKDLKKWQEKAEWTGNIKRRYITLYPIVC